MEQTQENLRGSDGEVPEGAGNSRRKSNIWNHFCLSSDGTVATCNYCQKQYGGGSTNGTSHLWRHNEKCGEQGGPPQKQARLPPPATNSGEPSVFLLDESNYANLLGESSSPTLVLRDQSSSPTRPAPSSSFNQEDCVAELAGMIAFHEYPSSIVDNECFRSFVRGLNPQFQMPSRAAVEATCHQRAQDAKTLLMETLAHCPGNISLAMGTAETDQGKALYMACQFIDKEWTLQKRILQTFKVVPFPPYHQGALMGIKEVSIDEPDEATLEEIKFPESAWSSRIVKEAGHSWGLSGRVFSVASNEELTATTDYLENLEFPGMVTHVTYTSDVMNSAADTIFSMLCPYFVDRCFKAVKGLRMDIEKRARYFSALGLNHVGRYDKRWYSYYCALEVLHKEFADNNVEPQVEQRRGTWIEQLIEQHTNNEEVYWRLRQLQEQKLPLLRRFKENQLTELLRNILGVIYRAIQRISSSRYPTSNLCIEELMKLREVLQTEAMDARQDFTKTVAYAIVGGLRDRKGVDTVLLDARDVLDKFLKASIRYEYFAISAILDPRFKLGYVTSVFNEVFGTEEAPAKISWVQEKIKINFIGYRWKFYNPNTKLPDWSITELERYLADDVIIPPEEREGFDVLIWWKENSHRYPTVARMARDVLAMPSSDVLSPEHLSLIRSLTSSYGAVYPKESSYYDYESESDDE